MAERSIFFNSAPGDPRTYQAQDFADYFKSVLQSGIIKDNGQVGLQVTSTGGLNLSVAVGKAIINGHLYENTTPKTLTVGLPDASTNRTDRVVLRLDLTNAARNITALVKRGTSSGPPALQRDSTVYEISLARIFLPLNTATINPANITDERTDRTVAGTVRFNFEVIADEIALQDSGNYFTTKNVEFAFQNYGAHRQNSSIHLSTQDRTDLTNAQKAKLVQDSSGMAFNVTTTVRPLGAGFYVYKGTSTAWMPAGSGNHVITNKRFTFGGFSTIFVHQTIEYQAGGRYWAMYNDDTQVWSGWTRIADEVDINSLLNTINSNYNEFASRTVQSIGALTGGATVTGTGNAAYKQGSRVFVELICTLANGTAAGTVIHTFSSALRPSKLTYMPIQANNNQFVQFAINASGQLIVNTAITSTTAVSIYNSFAFSPER